MIGAALTGAAPGRMLFLPMTNATGGAHLVTEEAAVTGRRAGRYVALCGAVVLAASLTTPERRYCVRCTEVKGSFDALRRGKLPRHSAGAHRRR